MIIKVQYHLHNKEKMVIHYLLMIFMVRDIVMLEQIFQQHSLVKLRNMMKKTVTITYYK